MKITIPIKNGLSGGRRRGFSLFEMLITMSIFAILGSLAFASLSNTTSAASKQKDKRNAQLLAGMASAANAAGAVFVVEGDEQATILRLCQGCSPAHGVFKGRQFKFPPLTGEDLTGAMQYLRLSGDLLEYRSEGGH